MHFFVAIFFTFCKSGLIKKKEKSNWTKIIQMEFVTISKISRKSAVYTLPKSNLPIFVGVISARIVSCKDSFNYKFTQLNESQSFEQKKLKRN